jgi:cyclophilin family peptidyl-prolyl cis-trans isomerase
MRSASVAWRHALQLSVVLLAVFICQGQSCNAPADPNNGGDDPSDPVDQEPSKVRLDTTMGDVVLTLYVDDAPVTTANFISYVEDGFYDGTIIHRVVPGFVVQGGGFLPDGTQPDGLRDPIVNEFSSERSNERGTIAMAKLPNDPDSATSQFFINLADNNDPSNPNNLDVQNGGFTVFGYVSEGMSVVDAMAEVELSNSVPVENIVINSATVEYESASQ